MEGPLGLTSGCMRGEGDGKGYKQDDDKGHLGGCWIHNDSSSVGWNEEVREYRISADEEPCGQCRGDGQLPGRGEKLWGCRSDVVAAAIPAASTPQTTTHPTSLSQQHLVNANVISANEGPCKVRNAPAPSARSALLLLLCLRIEFHPWSRELITTKRQQLATSPHLIHSDSFLTLHHLLCLTSIEERLH